MMQNNDQKLLWEVYLEEDNSLTVSVTPEMLANLEVLCEFAGREIEFYDESDLQSETHPAHDAIKWIEQLREKKKEMERKKSDR